MKFRKPINKKKVTLAVLAVLLVAGGLKGAYYLRHRNDAVATGTSTIRYEKATDTEKDETAANKDRIVQESQNPPSSGGTTTDKKAVTPTITQANPGGVNGYVSGIFEEGGTCTATFTKDATSLTKTSVGFQNVSYTQCAPISIESGFLSSGNWSVTLTYESATSKGVSAAQTIGVQ